MTYKAPLRDMRFQLWDVLGYDAHYAQFSDGADALGREVVDAIVDEGARFAATVLAPLNAVGDRDGCVLDKGVVRAPAGFRDAFKQYTAGGWSAVVGAPEYGGQGLPPSVSMLLEEMVSTANMAWGMYPGLSRGAAGAIHAHGTSAQKHVYLRALLSGEWTGTMCLTEPHAGSDVGLLRTRATPRADGSYAISGTKIFISAGEHDLADNIVHLVLARLPDAPAGTRGISLFIVPKYLPPSPTVKSPTVKSPTEDARTLGARNGVTCIALEEKMGIHGNATCQLSFDDATGFLLGPEHGGMRCMFTMMNTARVVVGIQGLAQMEGAYQMALRYARERLQMRALGGARHPGEVADPSAPSADPSAPSADPIIVHPDVRRMLLTQKALIEGCRGLIYRAGRLEDELHISVADEAGEAAQRRARASREMDLLTPVCKGFVTEVAFECVNHAVQIYGGHGFIRDNGVEQFVRDCRITLIYEGTTQIQALDLLGRKVAQNGGQTLREVIGDAVAYAQELRSDAHLQSWADACIAAHETWGELAQTVLGKALADPEEAGAASVDFLMYSGYALLAESWLRQAHAALRLGAALPGGIASDDFLAGKLATAQFYFERLLPRTQAHAAAMRAGAASLMQIRAESFAHD